MSEGLEVNLQLLPRVKRPFSPPIRPEGEPQGPAQAFHSLLTGQVDYRHIRLSGTPNPQVSQPDTHRRGAANTYMEDDGGCGPALGAPLFLEPLVSLLGWHGLQVLICPEISSVALLSAGAISRHLRQIVSALSSLILSHPGRERYLTLLQWHRVERDSHATTRGRIHRFKLDLS